MHLQKNKKYRLLRENDINFSKDFIGKPDLSYGWAKLNNEYLALLAFENMELKIQFLGHFQVMDQIKI